MSNEQHFIYILFSEKLNRFYVGSCSNSIEKRLQKHLTNHKGFTGKAKDWELVYSEQYETVSEARSREYRIKKWKSRKMIENLISSD